jgi:O-antigen/teichoic acid export membrane protein
VGELYFALSFTGIFTLIVLWGCDRYITRAVARNPQEAAHLVFNAYVTRIPLTVVCVAAMVIGVNVMQETTVTKHVVYILAIGLWTTAFMYPAASALQGLERMTLTSAAGIIEKVVSSIAGLAAIILAGQGMFAYALILTGAGFCSALVIVVHYLRVVGLSWRVDWPVSKRLIVGGWPFFIWALALLIYGTIDITMLSVMTDDDVVGWYGTAYRFVGIAIFFPMSVTTALLPSISAAPRDSKALIRRCLDLVVFISVPIAVFFFVGAQAIIDMLHYSSGFDHATILLRILSLHIPLTGVSMIAGTVLIAMDREGARTKAAIVAAILNPLLNLAAIPIFDQLNGNGAIGAAIISVFIEVFMLAAFLRMLEPGVFSSASAIVAVRCLAAGIVMGGVMFALAPYTIVAMTLFGSIVYVIAAIVFRAVTIDELLELPRLVVSRRTPEPIAVPSG